MDIRRSWLMLMYSHGGCHSHEQAYGGQARAISKKMFPSLRNVTSVSTRVAWARGTPFGSIDWLMAPLSNRSTESYETARTTHPGIRFRRSFFTNVRAKTASKHSIASVTTRLQKCPVSQIWSMSLRRTRLQELSR